MIRLTRSADCKGRHALPASLEHRHGQPAGTASSAAPAVTQFLCGATLTATLEAGIQYAGKAGDLIGGDRRGQQGRAARAGQREAWPVLDAGVAAQLTSVNARH